MCFFYFIEQDDRIWFAAYCLRQLSTFIISNVSRRRTNQTSRTELLLVFAHINTCHHVLVVKQIICQRLGQFCFSDTCRSQENKRTDWTFRVLQAGTASSNGICNGMNSLVLPNDTFMKLFFQVQQFFTFALQHLCHWDSCPSWYDLGNIITVNLFLNHGERRRG